jgi:hypothetical protein
MQQDNPETDSTLFFRTMDTCPINKKVQLLNRAGISTIDWWNGTDQWFVGWFPLPKIPEQIKKELFHGSRN